MSAVLATLSLALLTAAGFAVLVALAVALAWRALGARLATLHPVWRARAAFALAIAPTVVPAVLVMLVLAPGFACALGLARDHCLVHPGHLHLCFAHPHAALTPALAIWLALCAGALAFRMLRRALRLVRWRRQLGQLRLGARAAQASGVRWIPSERAFSLTVGLLRPEIWVSTALGAKLSPRQLEVVLAHERAHVRRRDALWRSVAHALSWPLPPRVRRALLAELSLASEQVCDAEAGRLIGDRLDVAETIVAVERLACDAPLLRHPAWAAFGDGEVEARVRQLVAVPDAEPLRAGALLGYAAFVLALVAVQPLHHLTEHVLAWFM